MRDVLVATLAFVVVAVMLGQLAASQGRLPAAGAAAPAGAAAASSPPTPTAPPVTSAPAATQAAADVARRPDVLPGPIARIEPATVRVDLQTKEVLGMVADGKTFSYMTFDGTVPGPFVRVRVGDTVELHLSNAAGGAWPHSIDLHAVTGPGGGAGATQTAPGDSSTLRFKALNPGIYLYHCATAPIPMHVASGMYGLILVEPEGGLPPVDREFYIVQAELYTSGSASLTYNNAKAAAEQPDFVVMNGRVGALTGDRSLRANVGERIRIYYGVGGFLASNFHVIGEIFDTVYPAGAIGSEPLRNVQTTLVPAGGATIVELTLEVPGRYLLVDHALPRVFDKGAVGYLEVAGPESPEIFSGGGSGH